MTQPNSDPFDDLRKLFSDEQAIQFVDKIYQTFRDGNGDGKTIIWWKNRKPRYFETSTREEAK